MFATRPECALVHLFLGITILFIRYKENKTKKVNKNSLRLIYIVYTLLMPLLTKHFRMPGIVRCVHHEHFLTHHKLKSQIFSLKNVWYCSLGW